MRNIIIIVALFILAGCAIPTLEELHVAADACESYEPTGEEVDKEVDEETAEYCTDIAAQIESWERRMDRRLENAGKCPMFTIEYEDRYGITCIPRHEMERALGRRY